MGTHEYHERAFAENCAGHRLLLLVDGLWPVLVRVVRVVGGSIQRRVSTHDAFVVFVSFVVQNTRVSAFAGMTG